MLCYLKVSDNSMKKLKEEINSVLGIDPVAIDLKNGIVHIKALEDMRKVAEKFALDSVNCEKEERYKIIGSDIEVGCIVRVSTDDGYEHAVIISENNGKYAAARIILEKIDENSKKCIFLRRGIDVIYKNTTYKPVITIVNEVAYDLDESYILSNCGEIILGRVVNQEILDQLELWDLLHDNGTKEETVEEFFGTDSININFEECVTNSVSESHMLYKLNIYDSVLKKAIEECVMAKKYGMKWLLQALQDKYFPEYTKQYIQRVLEKEFVEWINMYNVQIHENTLQYFLKTLAGNSYCWRVEVR